MSYLYNWAENEGWLYLFNQNPKQIIKLLKSGLGRVHIVRQIVKIADFNHKRNSEAIIIEG